ncbi:hypothetical protein D1610_00930 [Sphingomonas gilva]|uniref:Uncharacterized protein n=1 Tax=Sphingomonas gilva TaxID=2305907 RepID=A0A396RQ80_9SPHN|nr:hypothetical protein [Sphingomonas gilva]RHW18757.1 hypothetical protein D1610_00930 [Sphingomonas gilva]
MKIMIAALLAAFAGMASAQGTAGAPAQDFDAAVRALNQRIDQRPANTPLPRTSDPEVAKLLAVVEDRAGRFGTPGFPVRGYQSYQAVCGAAQALTMRYAMFGYDASAAAADPVQAEAKLAAAITANTRAYQNEIFPLMGFTIRCTALHVPVFEDIVARLGPSGMTRERRDGLAQLRGGLVQLIEGTLMMMAQSAVQPAHRAAMLKRIGDDSPMLVRMMTLQQRSELAARVARYAPAVPAASKGDLDRLRAALADRRCEGLCAVA